MTLHLRKIWNSGGAINRRALASVCTNLVVIIYCYVDFDGDDMISKDDLRQVIQRLTGEQQLSDDDMEQLIKNVCYFVIFLCWSSWIGMRKTSATILAYFSTRFALLSYNGLITARKRSLGQGNVCTGVCLSTGGSLYDVTSYLDAWSHVPSRGSLSLVPLSY